MTDSLDGKLAVVTGATRGIGYAIAQRLLEEGAEVVGTGTSAAATGPDGCHDQAVDFLDPIATEEFAKSVTARAPDILVNCAGINKISPFAEIDSKDFAAIQQVNVTAPFVLCRAVIEPMKHKGWGRIVNVSSVWGKVGKELRASYSTSKHGLQGMTTALAAEVTRWGILANCVSPGPVETEMTQTVLSETQIAELLPAMTADPWSMPDVVAYFDSHRQATDDIYPSEWFFLESRLREGISVLDIGCAQGGFMAVLKEQLSAFSYTGVDSSSEMIDRARRRRPAGPFHLIEQGDYSELGIQTFDFVLALGFLHLHATWRETLATAWRHTGNGLIFDLRESHFPTIEDSTCSYFEMDFYSEHGNSEVTVPYNIINSGEALAVIDAIFPDATQVSHFGYRHRVSRNVVGPIQEVMATVYCVER